jgi:hypothetical protein
MLAVFLYHAEMSWMPDGFLGVDVFFVISGYLITSLLLSERRRTGAATRSPPSPTSPTGISCSSLVVLSFLRVPDYDLALFHGGTYGWRWRVRPVSPGKPPGSSPLAIGDDRRQGQAGGALRAALLDERQARPTGRRICRPGAEAETTRRPQRCPDHQIGNNGPLYGDEMEALRKATSEVGELLWNGIT